MSMSQFEAFLTSEPNLLGAPIHPKAMLVILDPEDYDRWHSVEYDNACSLVAPYQCNCADE